jgi:hypothetical protein
MSVKAVVTLNIQSFVPWDASAALADPANCCKATASLNSSDTDKISLTTDPKDATKFTINLNKPGSNTTLSFVVAPDSSYSGPYTQFVPVGIALEAEHGEGQEPADPLGTNEFPSVAIGSMDVTDGDGNKQTMRALTFDKIKNVEDATWDFLLVIQAIDYNDVLFPVGIVDPRIKSSTHD